MMAKVIVDPQATPNPNAMKFNVSQPLNDGKSESYASKEAAQASPLAKQLFDLPGVTGVFILGSFVTVNKSPEASWSDLVPAVIEAIEASFS